MANDELRTAEMAERLGLSPETVKKYAQRGRIPFRVTPGGHRRFRPEAVAAALSEPTGLRRPVLSGPDDRRLGRGPEVEAAGGAAVEQELRAVASPGEPTDIDPESRTEPALAALLRHAESCHASALTAGS